MQNRVGQALAAFETGLARLRDALAGDPALVEAVFADSDDWADLLTYKLVPHLAGEGCLVVALAGGTNTGKSTIFNLLAGKDVSAVMNTAAATCHPVLVGSPRRYRECLEGKLVPEFDARPLENKDDAVSHEFDGRALFVAESEALPDTLVLLDTPDVDSIDTRNWDVADHIRAAGDMLVAVLTGEKYKDDRVVEFFREAQSAGRMVVPLMNKANPEEDFEVAAKQLADFREDTGSDQPRFVVGHDFSIGKDLDRAIESLDGAPDLREFLRSQDVPAIKERVFMQTVRHFADRAGVFLNNADDAARALRQVVVEFEERARVFARKYDPAPGPEVGHLFHEYVQSKRGSVRRAIGTASTNVVRGVTTVGKAISGALARRATMASEEEETLTRLEERHRAMLEQITRDLTTGLFESARNLKEPASEIVLRSLSAIDTDAVAAEVTRAVMKTEDVSEEFRAHAYRMLDTWWEDHAGRRRVLEALDTLLALMPAAIAAPISVYTGGVGVSEAVVFTGPLVAQFATRVMEYQFGDAMFDFLSPWKQEQQEAFLAALEANLIQPVLADVSRYLDVLEGETMTELRKNHELCLRAS